MDNHMADVASIFGLKFGEKFKLKEYGHIIEMPNYDGGREELVFFFSDDGIEYDSIYCFDVDDEDNVQLLFDIIVGKYEIVKLTGKELKKSKNTHTKKIAHSE